jgi:hypothetical protein
VMLLVVLGGAPGQAAVAGHGGVQHRHVQQLRERQHRGEPLQRAHPPPARRAGAGAHLLAREAERERGGGPRDGAQRRGGREALRPPRARVERRRGLRRRADDGRQQRELDELERRLLAGAARPCRRAHAHARVVYTHSV